VTNTAPEILLRVRRGGGAPSLGRQLESGLREAIRSGRLAPGSRLPASRALAADLGVSRRLVVEAFEQLRAEGWLGAQVGSGTYVRRTGPRARDGKVSQPSAPAQRRSRRARPRFDFFPGHPDLTAFPRQEWARLTREALRELPDQALGYGNPCGHRELRHALASYLARVRGVVCEPRQVVICQGAVQALGLIVRATGEGRRPVRIAVEDPYLPEHRDVLEHVGADVVPVPVDEHGVHDEAIVRARARLALLTPAHQVPTGAVLASGRRAALAAWAEREDALIIEDDYDAEYRYDRAPVGALQALAPERVIYLGSASKSLAPALRLGWMVVPDAQLPALAEAKRYADAGTPVLPQAAFARMLTSGAYDRHVRRVRRRQRERRNALVAAVAEHLPAARIGGVAAGLHVVVNLDRPVDSAALISAALAREVGVYPLNLWRADPPPETSAVVLGYGSMHPDAIAAGIERFAEAWREVA
jgi:GntR family transcriptional regulator/MocR family aminotransferase